MVLPAQTEPHIEVHKFHPGVVAGAVFLALALEVFLPRLLPRGGEYFELPFLVTLYFGLSRRNPVIGLLLGMVIGLLQDGLTGHLIGLFGLAKTVVGFGASSLGGRIDVDHPLARLVLGGLFYLLHEGIYEVAQRLLLGQVSAFLTTYLLLATLLNALLAVLLFPALDRLRRT
ncbi:MAG: rod shape-determining protein MreD [Firmicutes bacterium]|nr:rod shape-determining protein MreD [Bacillota bacterium]